LDNVKIAIMFRNLHCPIQFWGEGYEGLARGRKKAWKCTQLLGRPEELTLRPPNANNLLVIVSVRLLYQKKSYDIGRKCKHQICGNIRADTGVASGSDLDEATGG
jgi:hypothetical protein